MKGRDLYDFQDRLAEVQGGVSEETFREVLVKELGAVGRDDKAQKCEIDFVTDRQQRSWAGCAALLISMASWRCISIAMEI